MRAGDRAIHKVTCCIVEVLTVTGAWCGCKFIYVPKKALVHEGWKTGKRITFLKCELEVTGDV